MTAWNSHQPPQQQQTYGVHYLLASPFGYTYRRAEGGEQRHIWPHCQHLPANQYVYTRLSGFVSAKRLDEPNPQGLPGELRVEFPMDIFEELLTRFPRTL